MTAAKDDGKTPTDRPGDKREPAFAPAKPGATGSSAIAAEAAKSTDKSQSGAAGSGVTKTDAAGASGMSPSGGRATPGADPLKPGATGSSAINATPAGPTGSSDKAVSPSPGPAKTGASDSSAVKSTPASPGPTGAATTGATATPSAGSAKPGSTGSSAVSPGGTKPAGAAPGAARTGASGEQWLSAQLFKPSAPGAVAGSAGQSKDPVTSSASGASGAAPSLRTDGNKEDAAASGASKPEAAKPESGPQSATRLTPDTRVTDGPILDMKAKRIPDPTPKAAEPASRGAETAVGRQPPGFADPDAPGRGLGFSAVVAAGLLGGILGSGLVFTTLQWGASGPRQDLRADSPIEARLTALDKKIGGLATRDALTALDSRVATNERALKGLPEAVKSASDRAEEALKKPAGAPVTAGGEATSAAAPIPSDLVARIDALDQRVSALQEEPGRDQAPDSKLTATQSGEDATRLADLDARLKAIEVKAEADPVGPSPEMTEKLTALQSRLDSATKANESADQTLGQRLDQIQQALDARLGAATAAIAAASESTKQAVDASNAQAAEATKAADQRLQDQAEKLAALDKTLEGSAKATTVQAALRAIAAGRVGDALERGAPYADALSSLRGSEGVDPKQIAALEPFAEAGAPTAASLATAFRPVSEEIAAAQRAARAKSVADTGSVGDRLRSMAESVVQVKRVGGPASQATAVRTPASPEADPADKVQQALDRGRLVEAAQAFAALPEDMRAKTGDFGAKLKARADAALAAHALQAGAFKALSPASAER